MDNSVYQPQIYPQQGAQTVYQPQAVAAQPQVAQSQPVSNQSAMPSASAVNIVIQNPTANPPSCYPSNYYTQPPIYNVGPINPYATNTVNNNAAAPVANTNNDSDVKTLAAAPIEKPKESTEEETKTKNKKTKEVVQLTDDYIKTLENYLRNPNKDVRLMGAKELSKRFSEDDSRRDDKALNSLLDLVLQDKAQEIRFLGLAMVNGGLAQGDETTVQLLKGMQNSSSVYGQDSLTAADALLKMSGTKIKIPDNSPDKPEKKKSDEK